ncbi:proteasome activator subunit 4 [Scenedesmus sp. PABB004]|nr:proteasome activator subunit 4 [Scenedesmus sp. PABB004]
MAAPLIYSAWLPPAIAVEAQAKEPAKFGAAAAAFRAAAAAAAAEAARGNPNAYAALLGQLLDDLKTLVSTKTPFAASDITSLARCLYDVVLATADDVEVQVRVCELLNHVLRHHRHAQHLGLALPWRPLFEMLQRLYDSPPPQLKGTFLEHVQQSTLFTAVARARRFFAPGAAAEVWGLLRPALVHGDPMAASTHLVRPRAASARARAAGGGASREPTRRRSPARALAHAAPPPASAPRARQALGWLVLFFPTKQLPGVEPATARGWAAEWLGVWGRLVNCSYWDTHWMYLVARAAKDDWRGVVDWAPHVPALFTHVLAAFKVPVGTATAGCPSTIGAPHRAAQLFGTKLDQVDDQAKSAAKLVVHLLKQPHPRAAAPQPGAAVAAPSAAPAAAGGAEGLARALSLGLGPPGGGGGVSAHGVLRSGGGAEPGPAGAAAGLAMSPAVAAAADALDALVQLLEQFCHPSNTGAWSGDLAVFLRHGVHYFMKLLGRQCGLAGWPGEAVVPDAAARRYVRAAVKLAARGQFSKRECELPAAAHARGRRCALHRGVPHRGGRPPSRSRCAPRARAALVSASCKALCHLSYVWPEGVLPLVLGRFQAALATTTAMHQLPTAITSLALCVRPLLLAGWQTADESTAQLVAEAMMAVLPGIDANDEAKTAGVFQFYTAVLGSLPALRGLAEEDDDGGGPAGMDFEGGGGGAGGGRSGSGANGNGGIAYRLPLYLDDWVEQVMERLFTLLGNLDTGPSHRGTDQQAKPELLLQSTHLGKDTMYHSFLQHLLLRLPPRLADHVVALLGQFATGTALPTVALEASSMYRSASAARPAASVECVVKPLLAKIRAELPEPGTRSLSRSTEDSLTWHLVLLSSAVVGLAPSALEGVVPDIEALVDDTLKLPSRVAHNWASMVLSSTLGVLSSWHVADPAWAQGGGLLLPSGLQLWIDRQGVGWSPPTWALPSEAHGATAARLAEKYLEDAAAQLDQLCGGGDGAAAAGGGELDAVAFKTRVRGLLAAMAAVTIGLMSRLRDFEGFVNTSAPEPGAGGEPGDPGAGGEAGGAGVNAVIDSLQVVGGCAPPIGRPGARNRVAGALARAIRHLRGGDRELLEQASYTSLLLMCPGVLEQALGGQGRHGKDEGAIIDEPAAATAFILAASGGSGAGGAGGGFAQSFAEAEARMHDALDAERAAQGGAAVAAGRPGAGSWGTEWRWRRRASPLAVLERLRRMLLWRCAQAAAKAGPPAAAGVTPRQAAAGSVTPAGGVTLDQLPPEYVALFRELLGLSMQPNAGVRGSAQPTLHSCVKRFPCLVEVMLPEALAALAGVPGPAGEGAALPQHAALEQFYAGTLLDAMRSPAADAAAAPADAGAGASAGAGAGAGAGAAVAAAASTAAAKALAAASAGGTPAAKAAAAAALAAAAAGAGAGGGGARSVAEESANDGRVVGACALLAGCLDAWRVIFREPLVFRGFLHALLASRRHTSNACLKAIQMLIMQVISRFKLPPLLGVGSPEYAQLQAALISVAEPGARVTWRYAVLSNMVLQFAAPPAGSPAALPLLRHCLALLRSDMLLLRQVGCAGLWLQLAQLAHHGAANPALLDELRRALAAPGTGEALVRLLVLDHAKLDAQEAAKAARGGGGGGGAPGGLLSGLLGMTAEEVMGAMVAAAVERFDRWPSEGGRPAATLDGLFEISHARLVRLLATLCPAEALSALREPLAARLAAHPAPNGPGEKAEAAAVAEALAGLLASAAPAAAGGGADGGGGWALALLRDALNSATLEMSDAWGAALWYALDALLDAPAGSPRQSRAGDGAAPPADGGVASDALDVRDAPAAAMLQQLLGVIMAAVPGAAAGGAAAAAAAALAGAAAAAAPGTPGAGEAPAADRSGAGGALPSDLKRLKYLLHCLPPIRRRGTLGTAGLDAALGVPTPEAGGGDAAAAAAVATAAAAARRAACGGRSSGGGAEGWTALPLAPPPALPRSVRVFLAALMQEVGALAEAEQPTAMREVLGSLLADLAALFAAPAPLLLPPSSAAAAPGSSTRGSGGGAGSGCSTPLEIEMPPAAGGAGAGPGGADSGGALEPDVVLLNSSAAGLRAAAAALLQAVVGRFAAHAAALERLKNSGGAGAGGNGSGNANGGGNGNGTSGGGAPPSARGSDSSDDLVMVDAADAAPGGAPAPVPAHAPAGAAGLAGSLTACGVGLQALIAAVDSGESGSLRPLLAALLPSVLALQELAGPGLAQLSGEAKSGFVLYKYLPFGADHARGVAGAVLAAGGSDAWSSRAAALVFLQVFWFRHCFLLGDDDMERLQAFVVGRLQDAKVEVRALAAATLSGLIKALPAHEIDALRGALLRRVSALFAPPGGAAARRSGGGAPRGVPVVAAAAQAGPAFLAEAQAVVQGLKAFVLSSPYDVPPWMPEVLMALVGAANARSPLVRRDAAKALSEFKRTHEEDALDALRAALGEADWEALAQVSNSASYFV